MTMLKNEILTIDGTNWLVREATSRAEAENAIAYARVTGSIGSKHRTEGVGGVVTAQANVVRLDENNRECLPYGERGTDHSGLVAMSAAIKAAAAEGNAAAASLRASTDRLGVALEQSSLRGRVNAGALAQIEAWVTSDDPIYSDAAFLRQIIAKEIADARATIAEAKAAAQKGA
jgi:hypothetical protein